VYNAANAAQQGGLGLKRGAGPEVLLTHSRLFPITLFFFTLLSFPLFSFTLFPFTLLYFLLLYRNSVDSPLYFISFYFSLLLYLYPLIIPRNTSLPFHFVPTLYSTYFLSNPSLYFSLPSLPYFPLFFSVPFLSLSLPNVPALYFSSLHLSLSLPFLSYPFPFPFSSFPSLQFSQLIQLGVTVLGERDVEEVMKTVMGSMR
jgi:hypothetical protein